MTIRRSHHARGATATRDLEEKSMRIGMAGLGRMGAAIAARLIEIGHEVTV